VRYVFSLGVILYEMVAGTAPFHGESAIETLNAILQEDPPTLRYRDRRISWALERVVRHCLEKAPDRRFQTARDFIFGLELVRYAARRIERRPSQRVTFRSTTRRLLAALFN
jgi:serine/threonine protein kinase